MVSAIIAAAGSGSRMGQNINKIFMPLAGNPILLHSIALFAKMSEVAEIIVAASPTEVETIQHLLNGSAITKPFKVVAGGRERQYSIQNALEVVSQETTLILVHDGARPLVEETAVRELIAEARQCRAAIAAVPVKDTIKISDAEGFVENTPDRGRLWSIQTPQVFDSAILKAAYHKAQNDQFLGTDDASLVERLGVRVRLVAGSYRNIKITTPEDIRFAESLLEAGAKGAEPMIRVGTGYDVHRLVENRKLILGGVEIPFEKGLEGHSDADVLLHAIKDALLGAAALGDIGRHFPDNNPLYKGISSLVLLEKVGLLLQQHGFVVQNIDATVIAEKPKLSPYISAMNENIARVLTVPAGQINIKATTTEGLGFTGRKEGIAAQAVVLLAGV